MTTGADFSVMPETFQVRVLPDDIRLTAAAGTRLYDLLRSAALVPQAFCGGNGRCGKCTVLVDGAACLSCRTVVTGDMTVTLPDRGNEYVPGGMTETAPKDGGCCGETIAFDIGTTTVVCFLLDSAGCVIAHRSILNPQASFGADVVSRLGSALTGTASEQTGLIRRAMDALIRAVCAEGGTEPGDIRVISVVGNPAMQQLFLGLSVENLIEIPFIPKITHTDSRPAGEVLSVCGDAELRTVPDVSGYIGADTVACVLATELYKSEELSLLIDIGTNGEIVLGNKDRMLTCAAAAGPALEGANIRFGMRSAPGAIDHVFDDNGSPRCHVIGDTKAAGICGSGLMDAVAVFLQEGKLDRRGRILGGSDRLLLTDSVYLTQEDIREVQLAKAALAAGIGLLTEQLGARADEISRVYLAGAFGSSLSPASVCRIGLIPPQLEDRISVIGNAAGHGAQLIAKSRESFLKTDALAAFMEHVELAALGGFRRAFAGQMYFTAHN